MSLVASSATLTCGPPALSSLLAIDQILPDVTEWPPNPIATLYPTNITGLANGTIAVLPIPYEEARAAIPSQYAILKDSYESLLPGFPPDQYPVVIRSILEYDIDLADLQVTANFQQIEIRFPFVDLLGDGFTAFAWEMVDLIGAQNIIPQLGSAAYGIDVYPSTFVPEGRAYEYVNSSNEQEGTFLLTYTNASDCPGVINKFKPQNTIGPWAFDFYTNYTNMPFFRDPKDGCGQQITFFNTSVSAGEDSPKGIVGDVYITAPFLPTTSYFRDVHGVVVSYAWLENNYLNCSSLKGL